MSQFDPQAYGPVFGPLVDVERRRPLDAGAPNTADRSRLKRLSTKTAFSHAARSVVDRGMAECALAGVWLLHDFLDESHEICQSINTTTGSFWHAIMHRREGDASNAKYWFRRVGEHPVFASLAQRAAELAAENSADTALDRLVVGGNWEPYAFVDLCQSALRAGGETSDLCLDIQQAEWELLFDHSYRSAVGS